MLHIAGIAVCLLAAQSQFVAGDEMRAGVGIADITPPIPFRMSGYFNERLSTGVTDPLHAKAIVFQQGDMMAALVFCDMIGVSLDVSKRSRRLASEATGIPVEHIVVAATHSHTGPLYFGALHKHFHDRAVEKLGKDPFETVDYPALLVERIVAAVVAAKSSLQPVQLAAGNAREDRLSFNRRFHMKDGTVRFNPGRLNPEIVRAAGPIDRQVGAIWLKRPGESLPWAAFISFALHLDTVGGTEYSADFPYFVEQELRRTFGSEFALLFGAGTCGDINHIDVTTRESRTTEDIGRQLAQTLKQANERGEFIAIADPSLAVASVKVRVPLQAYSANEVAEARTRMELVEGRELPFLEQVRACTIMDLQLRGTAEPVFEIHAIRLSRDTAIVTLPGEVFVELGLAIKSASPFKTTLVIELANDDPAYIPTQKAFAEGSYEIVNSRIQPGGGERLVKAAIELVKGLQ
jgi:hypothetical protein